MGDLRYLPTTSSGFHVLDTEEGRLTWRTTSGPRGPIPWGASLDGEPIGVYELRLRLLAYAT